MSKDLHRPCYAGFLPALFDFLCLCSQKGVLKDVQALFLSCISNLLIESLESLCSAHKEEFVLESFSFCLLMW